MENTWRKVDGYFEERLLGEDPVLRAALQAGTDAGLPDIQVTAAQGKLLHLLALAQGARRILEVGTLGGYSGIWLARALPVDGRLITLEINPKHAQIAGANFKRAGLDSRVELRVGPALESLAQLSRERGAPFDLVFIDADKENNLPYLQAALAMSRVGTLIMVDNVVRDGKVAEPSTDSMVEGVRRMIDWCTREPRLSGTVIQTVGNKGYDGFLLARVQAIS
jgi:predicted O-methyltransferase YrrM